MSYHHYKQQVSRDEWHRSVMKVYKIKWSTYVIIHHKKKQKHHRATSLVFNLQRLGHSDFVLSSGGRWSVTEIANSFFPPFLKGTFAFWLHILPVCVASLRVLWLPPTVEKPPHEANLKLKIFHNVTWPGNELATCPRCHPAFALWQLGKIAADPADPALRKMWLNGWVLLFCKEQRAPLTTLYSHPVINDCGGSSSVRRALKKPHNVK